MGSVSKYQLNEYDWNLNVNKTLKSCLGIELREMTCQMIVKMISVVNVRYKYSPRLNLFPFKFYMKANVTHTVKYPCSISKLILKRIRILNQFML